MDWRDRIVFDHAIMGGQVCIKGTRIPVSVVLDNLAAGLSEAEILASYPSLTDDDVRAAIKYAAELAHEQLVPLRGTGTCSRSRSTRTFDLSRGVMIFDR